MHDKYSALKNLNKFVWRILCWEHELKKLSPAENMDGETQPSWEYEWTELSLVELPRKFESAQLPANNIGKS